MLRRGRTAAALMVPAWLAAASVVAARSLSDAVHDAVARPLLLLTPTGAIGPISVPDSIVPALQAFSVRGLEFPRTGTAAGVTYELDLESGALLRSKTLGPILAERPETVGRGKLSLVASVITGRLSSFDGDSLTTQASGSAVLSRTLAVRPRLLGFHLSATELQFLATYGLSDALDVSLTCPVIYSKISSSVRFDAFSLEGGARTLIGGTAVQPISEEAVGIGDLRLASKYRFWERRGLALAAELDLRLPTGRRENFQGTGDLFIAPLLVVGYQLGAHHLHATLGIDYDANRLERSRARYALGVSLQMGKWLALLVDLLGTSDLGSSSIRVRLPDQALSVGVSRRDYVDVSAALKVDLWGRASMFAGAIVPITDDGLRADVLPIAGVQGTF